MPRPQIATPPDDRSIIIVRNGDTFELRYWTRLMGDGPIGPRLGRKEGLPSLPAKADTFSSALDLQNRWQQWLDDQPRTGRGKKRR